MSFTLSIHFEEISIMALATLYLKRMIMRQIEYRVQIVLAIL